MIVLSFRIILCVPFKNLRVRDLNWKIFIPIKYAGTIPTSDKTEYLPPIKCLCSIKNIFSFLERLNNILFFLSEIKIIFFEFFFIIFSKKIFDSVSTVSPDLETTNIRVFFKFSFFLKSNIFFAFRSLKKYTFFFIFSSRKL